MPLIRNLCLCLILILNLTLCLPGLAATTEHSPEASPGLGELGLLGMLVPEKYGGSGLDNVSYALAIEELARVCPSTAVTVSVTNSVC